jgi:hypothetical protein
LIVINQGKKSSNHPIFSETNLRAEISFVTFSATHFP